MHALVSATVQAAQFVTLPSLAKCRSGAWHAATLQGPWRDWFAPRFQRNGLTSCTRPLCIVASLFVGLLAHRLPLPRRSLVAGESVAPEIATEVLGKTIRISQEPPLHTLDHQLGVFVHCLNQPMRTVNSARCFQGPLSTTGFSPTTGRTMNSPAFLAPNAMRNLSKALSLPPQAMNLVI